MAQAAYFTPELFRFLKELKDHNRRGWFEENKARYEEYVREPFLRLIGDLAPDLGKINPHMRADPRPTGGSLMRIHRDIRFSKDKSPYKTFAAAHFGHAQASDGAKPAYYLHLEPGRSSIGAGVWRPEPGPLKNIRDAIVKHSRDWEEITANRDFQSTCGMAGESLRRPPVGYDPQHPLIEDIKRKDFVTSSRLTNHEVCAKDFRAIVLGHFRKMAPLLRFLSEAVGLP